MILTDEEKQMRDGAEGAATAAAMDLLIRYGDALACDRLCDVRNVAGTMTQPSPVKERLVREGGWDKAFAVINLDCDTDIEVPAMRVPTCQLQHGFGSDARGVVPYPAQRIELQQDAESFYGRRGVSILATCTPYQVGNIPVRGEHIAWMESSAVIYANSVLGARTNCEGTVSAGAASLTGKIPCWGNHREENRYGTHLIDVRTPVDSFLDWGMLGYFAGGVAGEEHPVVTGDLGRPDLVDLKHFGAAAATSGGVELYHVPGITPEAPTLAAAFGGARTPEPVPYGAAERCAVYETLNSQGRQTDVDFVLLGCPHASVDQVRRAAAALEGRRLSPGAELWLMLPRALRDVADRSGYTEVIERAGGRLLGDSCPAMSRVAPEGTRVFATDSAKQAHYLPAIFPAGHLLQPPGRDRPPGPAGRRAGRGSGLRGAHGGAERLHHQRRAPRRVHLVRPRPDHQRHRGRSRGRAPGRHALPGFLRQDRARPADGRGPAEHPVGHRGLRLPAERDLPGTANTMHLACEALGMALPGTTPVRANSEPMWRAVEQAARRVVEMTAEDLRPRDILIPGAFANAVTAVLAVSGSINSVKHLQAVAAEAECGADVYRLFEDLAGRVPLLAAVRPNGEVPIEAFEDAGGARAVMKQLEPLLDTGVLTVTGRSVGQNLAGVTVADEDVIRPPERALGHRPTIVLIRGSLSPDYENISQVLAAMETIGPDGGVALYDATKTK